jgi:CDP-6-deoxy-D-xylo-4-hexulose-3-dehydrase
MGGRKGTLEGLVSPGDLFEHAGTRYLVLRGGARPLALRAHGAAPAAISFEVEPDLHVELEETVRLPEGAAAAGSVRAHSMARLIRKRIALDVESFAAIEHGPKPFVPGQTVVPYAGRVYDQREIHAAVDAALDFWLTLGPHGDAFQRSLASFLGVRASVLVNSGSSANLVAFATLTSEKLGGRHLVPGDEVITAAAGFPTTVNPILQHGCVPVFVDSDPATGNLDARLLDAAWSPKVRAVMLAHALGNPFDVDAVLDFCKRKGLWLIEDNCDALGSLWRGKLTGTFGDLSTQSFYPPHHMTMGEGGAVNVVTDVKLKTIVESFRDWGRDCWCDSGKSNTCGKRFDWKLGDLPAGYDHKYIYSHLGWNLKPLDLQAAIGQQQIPRLPAFGAARRAHWKRLREGLDDLGDRIEFSVPTPGSDPSWFGFLMIVKESAGFDRTGLVRFLEDRKIKTRMLFGGNLARQPAYRAANIRIAGSLAGADLLMNRAFFVGVYPGLTEAQLDWMIESIHEFAKRH